MKYKAGDVLQVKSLEWYNKNKDKDGFINYATAFDEYGYYFCQAMSLYCGKNVTIAEVCNGASKLYYRILEDNQKFTYIDEMFECIIESKELTKEEKLIQLIQDKNYLPQEEFNILIESYLDSLIPYNQGKDLDIREACNIDAISVTHRIEELRDDYKGSDFSIIVENIIKRLSKRELAFLMLANYITAK